MIDPPVAETPNLKSSDVNRPSLFGTLPLNPKPIDPEIVKPNPTSPLLPGLGLGPQDPDSPSPPLTGAGDQPTLTPTLDSTTALTPPLVSTQGLSEDCALKAKEYYLHPDDPCLDPLLELCDAETPEDNPSICGFDPRENPQGNRCINEQGQWSANVRECFPQREDILRELCGPRWEPGEECLIYGPEKTVMYGSLKVGIGNSPGGSNYRNIFCVEAPEGGCIGAPFAPGGGCDALPASAREKCEESKKSGFDEMRKQYLIDLLNQAYSDWQRQKTQQYEKELDKLLDDFNKFLDEQGIDNPCAGLSAAQCDQWFLDQEHCPGHPACQSWEDAFNDYLENNPDACAGLSRDACNRMLLDIDQCALDNPLCMPYEPDLQRATHGTPSSWWSSWYLGTLPEIDETDEEYNNPQFRIGGALPYSLWESAIKEEPKEPDWICRHFPGLCHSGGFFLPKGEAPHETLCRINPQLCLLPPLFP